MTAGHDGPQIDRARAAGAPGDGARAAGTWRDREERAVTWHAWLIVTEASAVAAVAVVPYVLAMQGKGLDAINAQRTASGKRPITPLMLAGLSLVQGHLMIGPVAALGLRSARRMGLGLPRLEALLRGQPAPLRRVEVARDAAAGAGAVLALGALDYGVFRGVLEAMKKAGLRQPASWQGLLAAAYGAVAEEVLMRLGAQTLIAAGLRRLRGETALPPSGATMWPAIGIASLLFGAGHLPAVAGMMPLTPALVARTLALNGVAGVVFGHLYWKHGLEEAMLAHGTADLLLHVAVPLIQWQQN